MDTSEHGLCRLWAGVLECKVLKEWTNHVYSIESNLKSNASRVPIVHTWAHEKSVWIFDYSSQFGGGRDWSGCVAIGDAVDGHDDEERRAFFKQETRLSIQLNVVIKIPNRALSLLLYTLAFALLCWRRPVSPCWRRSVTSLVIILMALTMTPN